jgi:hypothetical protein
MIFVRYSFDAPSLINTLLQEYFLVYPSKNFQSARSDIVPFRLMLVASWRRGDLSRGARSMVANSGKPDIEDYKQDVR